MATRASTARCCTGFTPAQNLEKPSMVSANASTTACTGGCSATDGTVGFGVAPVGSAAEVGVAASDEIDRRMSRADSAFSIREPEAARTDGGSLSVPARLSPGSPLATVDTNWDGTRALALRAFSTRYISRTVDSTSARAFPNSSTDMASLGSSRIPLIARTRRVAADDADTLASGLPVWSPKPTRADTTSRVLRAAVAVSPCDKAISMSSSAFRTWATVPPNALFDLRRGDMVPLEAERPDAASVEIGVAGGRESSEALLASVTAFDRFNRGTPDRGTTGVELSVEASGSPKSDKSTAIDPERARMASGVASSCSSASSSDASTARTVSFTARTTSLYVDCTFCLDKKSMGFAAHDRADRMSCSTISRKSSEACISNSSATFISS
mmetsp:Transcript_4187/g.13613  ORF Transcript_4187/g.13613 Transcript_4187/m.13613 type:complete len:386 (+) Transcript_4187:2245-3402(+)